VSETLSYVDEIDWLLSGRMEKEKFVKEFKKYVLEWTKNNEALILQTIKDKKYSWKGECYEDSVNKRNVLEYLIKKSREDNANCVDLVTLNKITQMGFWSQFSSSLQLRSVKVDSGGI
jgi:hypothetical protein